jgi:hypothetical protein
MLKLVEAGPNGPERPTAIQQSVRAYLNDRLYGDEPGLASLDRWSIARILRENQAKAELVEEAPDPTERCYQDLVREIDAEAQVGIFLPDHARHAAQLRLLGGEPGITGRLDLELPRVAPTLFADEFQRSQQDLDLVWVTIRARFDRAHIEAETSELMLMHLLDSEDEAADAADELRSVFYAFHEDRIRRSFDLGAKLDDRNSRQLIIKVAQWSDRAGSYADRIDCICRRAGTS